MPVAYAGSLQNLLTSRFMHFIQRRTLLKKWPTFWYSFLWFPLEKNVKPQQRLKTIHTLKLNLRIMEEGKGYSKGVGPFRVPTMWVSKLSSQWYAPSNIEDLSFKRQAVLPQGGCTMAFAVSVFSFFFYQRVLSASKRGACRQGTCDTWHFKHDTPTRKQSLVS